MSSSSNTMDEEPMQHAEKAVLSATAKVVVEDDQATLKRRPSAGERWLARVQRDQVVRQQEKLEQSRVSTPELSGDFKERFHTVVKTYETTLPNSDEKTVSQQNDKAANAGHSLVQSDKATVEDESVNALVTSSKEVDDEDLSSSNTEGDTESGSASSDDDGELSTNKSESKSPPPGAATIHGEEEVVVDQKTQSADSRDSTPPKDGEHESGDEEALAGLLKAAHDESEFKESGESEDRAKDVNDEGEKETQEAIGETEPESAPSSKDEPSIQEEAKKDKSEKEGKLQTCSSSRQRSKKKKKRVSKKRLKRSVSHKGPRLREEEAASDSSGKSKRSSKEIKERVLEESDPVVHEKSKSKSSALLATSSPGKRSHSRRSRTKGESLAATMDHKRKSLHEKSKKKKSTSSVEAVNQQPSEKESESQTVSSKKVESSSSSSPGQKNATVPPPRPPRSTESSSMLLEDEYGDEDVGYEDEGEEEEYEEYDEGELDQDEADYGSYEAHDYDANYEEPVDENEKHDEETAVHGTTMEDDMKGHLLVEDEDADAAAVVAIASVHDHAHASTKKSQEKLNQSSETLDDEEEEESGTTTRVYVSATFSARSLAGAKRRSFMGTMRLDHQRGGDRENTSAEREGGPVEESSPAAAQRERASSKEENRLEEGKLKPRGRARSQMTFGDAALATASEALALYSGEECRWSLVSLCKSSSDFKEEDLENLRLHKDSLPKDMKLRRDISHPSPWADGAEFVYAGSAAALAIRALGAEPDSAFRRIFLVMYSYVASEIELIEFYLSQFSNVSLSKIFFFFFFYDLVTC